MQNIGREIAADTTINQIVGGDLDFGSNTFNAFTLSGVYIWNQSGGSITTTGNWQVNLALTYNMSGGAVTAGSGGLNNGALLNISGTAVVGLDALSITDGTIDFLSGWTGSFTAGNYTAALWESLFTTAGNGTLFGRFNGSAIDVPATFNSTFQVTNGGTTLSLVPEPNAFLLLGLGSLGLAVARRRRQRSRS